MVISEEQAEGIKLKLLEQIDKVPNESRDSIRTQIEGMTPNQVEDFLKKNNSMDKCIFCSIIEGTSSSVKLYETEIVLIILDIKPLSKGHSLILLKEHGGKVTEEIKKMGEELGQFYKDKFEAKSYETHEIEVMGHFALEVIPIYGDETERYSVTNDILLKIKDEIGELNFIKEDQVVEEPEEVDERNTLVEKEEESEEVVEESNEEIDEENDEIEEYYGVKRKYPDLDYFPNRIP